MSLARELGGMTLYEMLDRITSDEITLWMALNEIEREEAEATKKKDEMLRAMRG